MALHPAEQGRGVGRDAVRGREDSRIIGGNALENGQAHVDGGAVLGIDPAVDRRREQDAAALLKPDEGIGPGGIVGRAARPGDRNKAATLGEPGQRRADMAQRRVLHRPVDMGDGRERRVHHHHARHDVRAQIVVDMRSVVAGDGAIAEQAGQHLGADLGQLVENQAGAARLGLDREQAGPGGGFEHQVARPDRGRDGGDEAQPGRRRELLERLRRLRPARMGGEQRRHLLDHRQRGERRRGFAEDRVPVFAQEQNLRRLAGVVGGLPIPGAIGIGAAERGLHRATQGPRVDGAAAFEIGQDERGGGENGPSGRGETGRNRKRRRRMGDGCSKGHGGCPQESREGIGRRTLSLDPADPPVSGLPLTLSGHRMAERLGPAA